MGEVEPFGQRQSRPANVVASAPGELAPAAARLDADQINIDCTYDRLEPDSTLRLLVFGVGKLTEAASLLDQLTAEDV